MSRHFYLPGVLAMSALLAGAASAAGPALFWASTPVSPGEAVLLTGAGLDAGATVELVRLADAAEGSAPVALRWPAEFSRLPAIEPRGPSLRFLLPTGLKPGVFAVRVRTAAGVSDPFLLNAPEAWWCQGDAGTRATPGGWLRVLGKGLAWPTGTAPASASLRLTGPRTVKLKATGDANSLRADLPKDLPAGRYELRAHGGRGGPAAWSAPLTLEVGAPARWPDLKLNVRDFGAQGRGTVDDTAAVTAALDRLRDNGGGVLYFPRGRYLVSDTLKIPEQTILRGEGRELVEIAWPDRDDPLPDLMVATRSFVLEDLAFFCSNYGNFLTVDMKPATAGDVHLRRLRVRANRFRGHMYNDPEKMSKRFTAFGVHGGKLLALAGDNVEVVDCDFLASGCALFLTKGRGSYLARNTFRMGRFGWFWLSGNDGVIFEDNHCPGGDLSTWGGGINTLDGSPYSRHVYFARNHCEHWYGGDNELTSDASGQAYFGAVASTQGTTLTVAEDPAWGRRDWHGGVVAIIGGTGVGQYRRLVSYEGRNLTVDRPWQVPPDPTSRIIVNTYQGDYLLLDNRFNDIGVIQFYGLSFNHLCAGNTSARTAGFLNMALNYHGIQPTWYVQWLRNTIEDGSFYDSAHSRLPKRSVLGTLAGPPSGDFPYAYSLGTILRGNRLLGNATLLVGGGTAVPCVWDPVVEGNLVTDSEVGLEVSPGAVAPLVRENRYERVDQPVRDLAALLRQGLAARQAVAGLPEPLASWDFADLQGRRLPDRSPRKLDAFFTGVLKTEPGGPTGTAARFTGREYLQVSAPDEPGQNLLNQTAFTLAVWVKPDTVEGRQGLLTKRFDEGSPPFVLSLYKGALLFEAADVDAKWEYNFSAGTVKVGEWQHLAATCTQGQGVRLFLNGKLVGEQAATRDLLFNNAALVIGREPWPGPDPGAVGPVFYRGLMGPIKFWSRALTDAELAAEAAPRA